MITCWTLKGELLKPFSHLLQLLSGKELDGNEIEVTLAKPVDKDHRQAKAAAKAMMSGVYNCVPYDYTASFGFPYNSQYLMYNPMQGGG